MTEIKVTTEEVSISGKVKVADLVSIGQLAKEWYYSKLITVEPSIHKNKESWKLIFAVKIDSRMRELVMYFSTCGYFENANFND
jgi:hypothetical protein